MPDCGLSLRVLTILLVVALAPASFAYDMEYRVKILPDKQLAEVTLHIPKAEDLIELSFKNKPGLHKKVEANGSLRKKDERYIWQPPHKKAWISLQVNLLHERKRGDFDSYINDQWAIFRGDDLFPPVRVRTIKGARSKAKLAFELPPSWPYVNTAWRRNTETGRGRIPEFLVDNPERRFDRPTGWIIAGDIATRRDVLGETLVSISGPKREHSLAKGGTGLKRMEALTLLKFVWPEFEKLFNKAPEKLLVVGAGDPMWRGGLSGPYSLFMHADRPLVSENATSTLLHEVFHSLTRIRGGKQDDWIAEGLAEYYSVEFLYRAGGMTKERRENVYAYFNKRAENTVNVRGQKSHGRVTARAVLIFRDLNQEIEKNSDKNLDELVRLILKENRKVDLKHMTKLVHSIIGKKSKVLNSVN